MAQASPPKVTIRFPSPKYQSPVQIPQQPVVAKPQEDSPSSIKHHTTLSTMTLQLPKINRNSRVPLHNRYPPSHCQEPLPIPKRSLHLQFPTQKAPQPASGQAKVLPFQ
ncbi:unnamed protein product [Moneuplotes crassus]|uniref:Uncharacterized protein n=1 Tax=Euplotes crassus TaxID=5936 RepID=A0AAD1X569_EUPCR|nr:unnamed protein product [Moneuplotes crassus]